MDNLAGASELLDKFRQGSLRSAVAEIEKNLVGLTAAKSKRQITRLGVSLELLIAALLVKRHARQIDELVHAIGILLALPHILDKGESVERLSLAAGNTGKGFDLETNMRLAEFTFIRWQGGSEVIRQNKIFKDFYFLAEAETKKVRELYVVGVSHPAKFFESRRTLEPILDGNAKLGRAFRAKYGLRLRTVRDYFLPRRNIVLIRDLAETIPALRQ
jgi:hypothetical protein